MQQTKQFPTKPRQRKSTYKWLLVEAIKIAEDRREAKARGFSDEVGRLNADFQRQVRKDKEAYLEEKYRVIEESSKKGRSKDLFRDIREITGTFHAKGGVKNSHNGRTLTEA